MYLLYVYNFENLYVARCRHDYGLWATLAKELKGQMSIVTVLPDFWPNLPLMKALDWAETSGKTVTIDICPLTSLASAVLNA